MVLIIRGSNFINIISLSSSAPDGHLHRIAIPDAILIQLYLLMMSTTLLETCGGL